MQNQVIKIHVCSATSTHETISELHSKSLLPPSHQVQNDQELSVSAQYAPSSISILPLRALQKRLESKCFLWVNGINTIARVGCLSHNLTTELCGAVALSTSALPSPIYFVCFVFCKLMCCSIKAVTSLCSGGSEWLMNHQNS